MIEYANARDNSAEKIEIKGAHHAPKRDIHKSVRVKGCHIVMSHFCNEAEKTAHKISCQSTLKVLSFTASRRIRDYAIFVTSTLSRLVVHQLITRGN